MLGVFEFFLRQSCKISSGADHHIEVVNIKAMDSDCKFEIPLSRRVKPILRVAKMLHYGTMIRYDSPYEYDGVCFLII